MRGVQCSSRACIAEVKHHLVRQIGSCAISASLSMDDEGSMTMDDEWHFKDSQQKRGRKWCLLATLLLAPAIFFVLAARLWTSIDVPSFHSGPDEQSHATTNVGNHYQLHPHEHAFRDPRTLHYHWRITAGNNRPDGVLKRVFLVNGEFPGPLIETRSGDRLIISVENALDHNATVSLHWHGLAMRGSNHMDGAAGVTQKPIIAGQTFTYDFTIDDHQHGTFWWHAHDGVQRADGLFGGLIVHRPAAVNEQEPVALEHLLMIGDWYHRSAADALESYAHPGAFGIEPVPDSILVNGMGRYICEDAVPARPVDCQMRMVDSSPVVALDFRARNILRVVNVGAYAGIEVGVQGARLQPVAVDGGHTVDSVPALTVGVLQPGERVDLAVEPLTSIDDRNHELVVSLDTTQFKNTNTALTSSQGFPVQWTGYQNDGTETSSMRVTKKRLDLEQLKPTKSNELERLPSDANETILVYVKTQKFAHLDNIPLGFINNTSWRQQVSPPEALIALDRSQWDKNQFVPHVLSDSKAPIWVDIVVNNLDEEGHPFHLHGHDFWVLSKYTSTTNWGSWNPFEDDVKPGGEYDIETPLRKDTVIVPRRGYAVLRVKMDNPGIWMFHCKFPVCSPCLPPRLTRYRSCALAPG
nr:laccase-1 [Quercus suber]